jgi:transposase, IS30 family
MAFEVRSDRSRRVGKLEQERAEYLRLMELGYTSMAACRIVGVNYRTGKRWRNGMKPTTGKKGAPPVFPELSGLPGQGPIQGDGPAPARRKAPESGRYLSEDERIYIADRLREDAGIREIAREVGRHPSTVSREVKRNACLESGDYRPHAAQQRAMARRPRPKPAKIGSCPQLRDYIQDRLGRKWSPEQVCHALRKDFPARPEMRVCHETIYQALYVQGRGELRRELTRALRTGRAVRKPRRLAQQRQPRYRDPMVMITDRPAEAADRAVPGHWEGDLIIGRLNGSQIGTLVERATRYVMLVHLPADRNADTVSAALAATMATLPAHLKRSLTWDQGAEMGMHRQFSVAAGMPVYFCDPHSPWQRGSNENTNGLLRQYFPKGADLSVYTRADLGAAAAELNSRPRKALGWDTPAQRLAKLLETAS